MHNRALNEREIIKNPYRFLYSIHDFGIKQNLLKASPAPWAVMSQNADLHIKKLYIYHKRNQRTVNKCVQVGKPEDRTASERARQAATDKFPFSICSEPKNFSKMGQKTLSSESIESSAAGSVAMDMGR